MKKYEKKKVPRKSPQQVLLEKKVKSLEEKRDHAYKTANLYGAEIKSEKTQGIITKEMAVRKEKWVLFKKLEGTLHGLEIHRLRKEKHAVKAAEKVVEKLEKKIDWIDEHLEVAKYLEDLEWEKENRK